ncbi:MAG: IclR family transcriptional regulator [Solirubrobacteraceae bacterium]
MSPRVSAPTPGGEFASVPTLRSPQYSQSLERGLAILGYFSLEHHVLGITELSDMLGMSRPTTHRYAATLVALGYLERCSNHKYRLGLRVTDLGMSALTCTGLHEHSNPVLRDLHQYSSFTVSLTVLDSPEILYVDRARSFRRGQYKIDLNLRLGSRLPAHCTAMGKVLLAGLPDRELTEILARIELDRRGPNTITTRLALSAVLERVREEGMAVNDEELAPGLLSIAVPVSNESRETIAAINMAAHTSMISLTDLVDRLLPDLLAGADQISARLGYRRDDEVV